MMIHPSRPVAELCIVMDKKENSSAFFIAAKHIELRSWK
jgi:hypothetical protein